MIMSWGVTKWSEPVKGLNRGVMKAEWQFREMPDFQKDQKQAIWNCFGILNNHTITARKTITIKFRTVVTCEKEKGIWIESKTWEASRMPVIFCILTHNYRCSLYNCLLMWSFKFYVLFSYLCILFPIVHTITICIYISPWKVLREKRKWLEMICKGGEKKRQKVVRWWIGSDLRQWQWQQRGRDRF